MSFDIVTNCCGTDVSCTQSLAKVIQRSE